MTDPTNTADQLDAARAILAEIDRDLDALGVPADNDFVRRVRALGVRLRAERDTAREERDQLHAALDLTNRQLVAETFGAETVVGPGGEWGLDDDGWAMGRLRAWRAGRGWDARVVGTDHVSHHPTAWAAMEAAAKAGEVSK